MRLAGGGWQCCGSCISNMLRSATRLWQIKVGHKVTGTGHFTTKHFSRRLFPEFAFINTSFGYRVNEPTFGTHSSLNTVYGTGACKNEVTGDLARLSRV